METRAHHVLIGLFVIVSVCAALLFALWLGGRGHDRQYALYDIAFHEAVSGLSRGSTVEFNGIRIGDVDSLRLDPENPQRVFARVRIESSAPMRSDTRARLVPAGITGLSLIRLSSGDDPAAAPLLPSNRGTVPIIVAQPSSMSRLFADGEDVMMQINDVLMRARELLSADNTAHIHDTLANLQLITATLAEQRGALTSTIEEAGLLLHSTRDVIDGELRQTLASAQRSVESFERTMQSIDTLVSDNRDNMDTGLRGMADIGPAITEFRSTLASLRGILDEFEESPRDYLFGRRPGREFQP